MENLHTKLYSTSQEKRRQVFTHATITDLSGGQCLVVDPTECAQSGLFLSQCKFRIIGSSFLAMNPQYLVGDFEEYVDDDGDSSSPLTPARSTELVTSWTRFIITIFLL